MSDSQWEETSPDAESGNQSSSDAPDCKNRDYRFLAISSIICGLSCIGILSLIYSVKARALNKRCLIPGEEDREAKAKEYSKKALTYGILAIVVWVVILISFPLLVGLVSFLLTLKD